MCSNTKSHKNTRCNKGADVKEFLTLSQQNEKNVKIIERFISK